MDKSRAKDTRSTFSRSTPPTRNVILPERTLIVERPTIHAYKRYSYAQKKLEDIIPTKTVSSPPPFQKIENLKKEVPAANLSSITPLHKTSDEKHSDKAQSNYSEELAEEKSNLNKFPEFKKPIRRLKNSKKRSSAKLSYALIAIITASTGYLFFDTWKTNKNLKQDLVATVSALGAPNAEVRQNNEGKDETPVKEEDTNKHTVAPSLPRIITIQKINVRARVLSMDVNPDNSIQAPINVNDAGWYTGSSKPGEPGAALIDGHVSGPTGRGIFKDLNKLLEGDEITIERGDGKKFIYEVVHTETVKREEVDMQKIIKPYLWIPQGLNVITCAGTYNKDASTYDQRLIVYTNLVRQE